MDGGAESEKEPGVPAALPATVGVRTLGRGMALIMGSVFLLIVGGSLAFVFGAGIGFILGEKEGLAILCCLGLVALAVVVGLLKGWCRCILGVVQMRQAARSMCVVQVATGLAIAGCSLDLDVVGPKAIFPLCVLTIAMAILTFLQLDRVAWIASAVSPDSSGNSLRGA